MTRTILTQLTLLIAFIAGVFLAGDIREVFSSAANTIIVIAALVLTVASAVCEIVGTAQDLPRTFKGRKRDAKILKYMTRLLSTNEQCVISSNDLSWVKNEAEIALINKARDGSLHLLMPAPNSLSKTLTSQGAVAYYYGTDGNRFRSRFTLINPGRSDARVAIGYGTKDAHRIQIIQAKDNPALHLVEDLYDFIKRTQS
ncbi:hypothetical protein Bequi_11815 [Brachybacterium sp. JHP9]|uniref:Uncharacterized protein n=1 Tax=Brachybacterium equifaecis TaxID=2910770 RepID=A0ABT0R2D1_9MICO|nr:hypothetical protein [Brachybacterium equifaecis]MCL6424056.1 hypothetical protein [Brachybacterium equifaecis]